MKLKILVAPVLIVLIVVMAVWVVYPAFQDLQSNKASLGIQQANLKDIQEKNSKAEALAQSLNGSTEQRDILLGYIPEQKNEEEMINEINNLSSSEGLTVYKITVTDLVAPVVAAPVDASGSVAADSSVSKAVAPAMPTANNFTVDFGVAGNYAKIKELLGKIAALRRFNSISSLKITKSQDAKVADDSTVDNLQADINVNFNYMVKGNSVANLDNSIFSSGSFDMSVVENIKDTMSTVVDGLTVDAHFAPNPFVK